MADSATLASYGIDKPSVLHHNLSYEAIAEHEQKREEGQFVKTQDKEGETCAVDTGKFTGRSPKDKFIVRQAPSQDHIWWGSINQPTTPEVFEELRGNVVDYLNGKDELYVFDGYVGASKASRRHVRFVSEFAWQHHFVTNMFRRPDAAEAAELSKKEPDFTVLNASNLTNPKWKEHGLHSEVFVVFNIEQKLGIIGGTWYGGEMKKGIFSMMNFWLPLDGTLSMHCSCNVGEAGDTALFFGLSGTGKTTLSADPKRRLIGDDEHGWDDHGVFNLEGGCYAKTIGLDAEAEPEIYNAIRRDALLENIAVSADGSPDYNDSSKTENGRVSYPLHFISNHEPSSTGGHPTNIVFLTCDAYGVLPPVSKLTPEQAMYHFLSGYTAKVAGTERGITEPQATFSACFGAAFMTQHPTVYAKLLGEKMRAHNAHAYLVNTGWSGGAYGVGSRMKIGTTRACIDAIMDGSIRDAEFVEHPTFKVAMPTALPKIDPVVLQPRNTWADKDAYDAMCKKLATEFIENYQQFQAEGFTDFSAHGPQA